MNSPELTTISWIFAPEGSSFDSAYAAVVKDGWALKAYDGFWSDGVSVVLW